MTSLDLALGVLVNPKALQLSTLKLLQLLKWWQTKTDPVGRTSARHVFYIRMGSDIIK